MSAFADSRTADVTGGRPAGGSPGVCPRRAVAARRPPAPSAHDKDRAEPRRRGHGLSADSSRTCARAGSTPRPLVSAARTTPLTSSAHNTYRVVFKIGLP